MNVNLAPVLDISRHGGDFIDQLGRSYGRSPREVSRLGAGFILALQAGGVAAVELLSLLGKPLDHVELAEKLIARKNDIASRADSFGADENPESAESSVVFGKGKKLLRRDVVRIITPGTMPCERISNGASGCRAWPVRRKP